MATSRFFVGLSSATFLLAAHCSADALGILEDAGAADVAAAPGGESGGSPADASQSFVDSGKGRPEGGSSHPDGGRADADSGDQDADSGPSPTDADTPDGDSGPSSNDSGEPDADASSDAPTDGLADAKFDAKSDATSGACQDPSDCPAPTGSLCTVATCTDHVCSTGSATEGAMCADNGGSVCNASGECVPCNLATDCPASASPCVETTCTSNTCGTVDSVAGTHCGANGLICDGLGTCVGCLTAGDCVPPATTCLAATCTAGMCGTSDVGAGTACNDHGGSLCNGSGACVGCNSVSDCPASDTACRTPTCANNVCGSLDAPPGTACTDHGGNLCSASGTCVKCNAASDCPAQTSACLENTCTNGTCGTSNASEGTSCGGNGMVCDAAGACVECNSASDCPAPATKCLTNTCANNTCGTADALVGTPCTDHGGTTCDGLGSCIKL